jgi:hypothetical protein
MAQYIRGDEFSHPRQRSGKSSQSPSQKNVKIRRKWSGQNASKKCTCNDPSFLPFPARYFMAVFSPCPYRFSGI